MRAIWTAFIAIALISVGAWYALNRAEFSAADRSVGGDVRID